MLLKRLFWGSETAPRRKMISGIDPYGPAAVFVHGLGGSAASTWSEMVTACLNEPQLDRFSFDLYEYPTSLFRLPFAQRSPRIQQLASGLKTMLELYHSPRSQIVLVAHSLGGLIVRQYLINEIKNGREPICRKVIFYATPHNGASLAAVGSIISWNHLHLRQLCQASDFIDNLNEEWLRYNVEDRIATKYIAGGLDAIVSPESAVPHFGSEKAFTIIDANHRSIIRAASHHRHSFVALLNFLAPLEGFDDRSKNLPAPSANADPLFDIYNTQHDAYYVKREIDFALERSNIDRHIWLSGHSGNGKTSAARRYLLNGNGAKNVLQIFLGGYATAQPLDLVRAICLEVAELSEIEVNLKGSSNFHEISHALRKVLRLVTADVSITMLIEEMRFGPECDTSSFLELLSNLITSIETDTKLHGRVRVILTSILDPLDNFPRNHSKLRERVDFIGLASWSDRELFDLIDVIEANYPGVLNVADRPVVIAAAKGSPRFVKALYRTLLSGRATEMPLEALLQKVGLEQI